MRRVLLISNGHGEIAIAERIAATALAGDAGGEPFALDHLPLVGIGRDRPGFPVVGPRAALPSGGLVAMGNLRAFAGDVAAGFAGLVLRQLGAVRRARYDGVVAVGDLYAFGFAALVRSSSGEPAPAIFVGTAKSVSVAPYGPGERRILARACRIFVRDAPTATALRAAGLAAEAPGNVIVDLLDPLPRERGAAESLLVEAAAPWIAVLPGSRASAYADALRLLGVLRAAAASGVRPRAAAAGPLSVVCSIAPGLDARLFAAALRLDGWRVTPGPEPGPFVAAADGIRVVGRRGPLGPLFAGAAIAFGQAGTANEQAAAAGVPVVALATAGGEGPGGGDGWYRMRQRRLLGEALALVPTESAAAVAALAALLADAPRLARMGAAGRERMGGAGGAAAIATAIRAEFSA